MLAGGHPLSSNAESQLTSGSIEASPVFCQCVQETSMRNHNHCLLLAVEQPRAQLCSTFLHCGSVRRPLALLQHCQHSQIRTSERHTLEFHPSSTKPKSIFWLETSSPLSQSSPALTCLSNSSLSVPISQAYAFISCAIGCSSTLTPSLRRAGAKA
jgi:hypothetical protein